MENQKTTPKIPVSIFSDPPTDTPQVNTFKISTLGVEQLTYHHGF
jgi:hypothetical protein